MYLYAEEWGEVEIWQKRLHFSQNNSGQDQGRSSAQQLRHPFHFVCFVQCEDLRVSYVTRRANFLDNKPRLFSQPLLGACHPHHRAPKYYS